MATPVQLATNIFCLNGVPLELPHESMRHIYPIYNRPSRSLLLKFGRQTHKSTTVGYKLTLPAVKYSNYHSLYVAPTGNQVSVFSSDKLDNAMYGSDIIKNHYFNTKTKNQISYKELNNGSKIYLRSAFHTADSIRGISADQTTIDEIQDIISDHIPVIEQCMSHSLAKWEHMKKIIPKLPMHYFNSKMYAGTPKTVENTMERYWAQSTQNEWIILCLHCNRYNYINEYNIGDTCLICNKCGKPIFYENGQWISMNAKGFIDGYRLPQIILPWINNVNYPEVWKMNVINTRTIYSTEQYFNEVLALPYAAARHPISSEELIKCCEEDRPMMTFQQAHRNPELEGNLVFAGIDWGKGDLASGTSYTILTISAWIRGFFRTIFMKKYTGRMSDPLKQVEDIIAHINRFRVNLTIADTGDGRTSNAMVAKAFGASRFGEVYEHGTIRKKIRFDKEKGHYVMNRTRMMTDVIMEIKRGEVKFFKWDEFKEFQPDFTGIYSEYSERLRMTKYDHIVPDDAFHSWMFSRMACAIARGEFARYLSGGINTTNDESSRAISLG